MYWLLALCTCALLLPQASAKKAGPRPYALGIEFDYGREPGPQLWRDELELQLIDALQRGSCFQWVDRWDTAPAKPSQPATSSPGWDLKLRLSVFDFLEHIEYDTNVATLHNPDAPPGVARLVTARVSSQFTLDLMAAPADAVLRSRTFKLVQAYRPVLNEDPNHEARMRLIESAINAANNFACKGNAKKLARELERARGASPQDPSR